MRRAATPATPTGGLYSAAGLRPDLTHHVNKKKQKDAQDGLIAGVLAADGVVEDDINNCFAPPLVDPAFASAILGK